MYGGKIYFDNAFRGSRAVESAFYCRSVAFYRIASYS